MVKRSANTTDSGALQRLRSRLARWRREHGGRGRRIPEDLWAEAAWLAATEGEAQVAREAGLSRKGLAWRVAALSDDRSSSSFVEVAPAPHVSVLGGDVAAAMATVFVVGPSGERLQLELTPARSAAAGEVVAAFLKAVGQRCSS